MNSLLLLYRWLTGKAPEPMSPERAAYEHGHKATFLYGPLDGLTEAEAEGLRFTWGTDQGEAYVQYMGHRYYHTGRHWRWAGWVREEQRT